MALKPPDSPLNFLSCLMVKCPVIRLWEVVDDAFNTFISEIGVGKHVPRVVFVDLEPTIIDEVRTGTYHQLFHPEQLIMERKMLLIILLMATILLGKRLLTFAWIVSINLLTTALVSKADNRTGLQGFLVFNVVGGGTYSGLGSLDPSCLSISL